MSLFTCLDKIDNALTTLSKDNTFFDKAYLFFTRQTESDYDQRKQAEITLFKTIRHHLAETQELIETEGYIHLLDLLDDLLPPIKTYLDTHDAIFTEDLKYILEELAAIALKEKIKQHEVIDDDLINTIESIIQQYDLNLSIAYFTQPVLLYHQQYKIADVQQGRSALGTSGGMCYGMVSSMAIPHLSPYLNAQLRRTENEKPHITITRQIYDHQIKQQDEKADQAFIKKTVLTRKHFCFTPEQLIKEIIAHAKSNLAADLQVIFYGVSRSHNAHACYLRIQPTQNNAQAIWYMDPNFGAYCFDSEAAFIAFYMKTHPVYHFTGYQLSQMQYDPNHTLSRRKSFLEIYFSLLTGPDYPNFDGLEGGLAFFSALCVNMLTPILILNSIALISTLLFPPLVAAICYGLTLSFLVMSSSAGYQGLLGPFQFAEACCHQLGTLVMNYVTPEEQSTEESIDATDEADICYLAP